MKRREFLRGLLGSAALAVLAGKRKPKATEPVYATLELDGGDEIGNAELWRIIRDGAIMPECLAPWPPHEFDVNALEVRDVRS